MNRTSYFWPFRQLPYDAQGNRVLKEETGAGGAVSKRTWYVRDAAGQHLTTYEQSGGSGTPRAKEYLLYGSSRLGTAYADNANGGAAVSGALYRRVVGQKQYEVADHLGNVRATVGDIKVRSGSTFAARVESHTEYFPFGMVASTATVAGGVAGRFGFNGMEKDNEVKGEGNHVDFGARWYDTRIARWGSVDPLAHQSPDWTPFRALFNNPIRYVDSDGRWEWDVNGNLVAQKGDQSYSLASFLGTTQSNAMTILNRGGVYENKKGILNLKEGQSFAKKDLWVESEPSVELVVNDTEEALTHYFNGNGESADVGERSTFELLSSDKFKEKHETITSKKVEPRGDFFVDLKEKTFHIGRTNVDYSVSSNGKSSAVTYTLFS